MRKKSRKSICFISETGQVDRPLNDPSVRYRCYHPAEVLTEKGHLCVVYSAAQFYKDVSLDFDVYVFHRPNMSRKDFDRITDYLEKMGKIMIADYDDLIFGDEQIALQSSAVKNGTLTEEKAISAFSSNLGALKKFSLVTTSTEALAHYATSFNKKARVKTVSNFLPASIVKTHAEFGTPYRKRPSHTIGYFAGTRSHDKDFPIVEEVLYRVLMSKTRGTDSTPEKRERFAKECAVMQGRWRALLGRDPFYNPSLALLREDYSLGPRHAGSPTHGEPSRPTADQHLPNGMTQ